LKKEKEKLKNEVIDDNDLIDNLNINKNLN